MNKKILLAGGAIAAGVAGFVVHGYLDVMYKPHKFQTLASVLGNAANQKDMDFLLKHNTEKHKWIDVQDTEVLTIKNKRGQYLKGYYTKPEKESNVFVFFAHGYRADHGGDPANFQQYYLEKGYNFFCVDHTTCGDSEGKWVGFDYYECPDCLEWLDYIIDRFGEDIKIIVHGVSMGGATVCKMSNQVPPQVKLIVADCPYTSAVDEFVSVVEGAGIKKTDGIVKLFNTMNKKLAGYDLADTDVRESVKNAKVPMLFVHGNADDFVPTRMGVELYDLCSNEKDLLLVDGATHAASIAQDEALYQAKLDEFIAKYL